MHVFEKLVSGGQIVSSYDERGIYSYGGDFLAICQGIDDWFVKKVNRSFKCREELYPTFMPLKAINRVDYFSKFPTMAYVLYSINNSDEKNIAVISRGASEGKVKDEFFFTNHGFLDWAKGKVFNPSTCYHTFLNHKGNLLKDDVSVWRCIIQRVQI